MSHVHSCPMHLDCRSCPQQAISHSRHGVPLAANTVFKLHSRCARKMDVSNDRNELPSLSGAKKDLDELLVTILSRHEDLPKPLLWHSDHSPMSLAELQQNVFTLASALKGPRVAILMHRSFALAVSLLAVLWSKRAFVPLDPTFPQKRLEFILEDSETSLLILSNEEESILEAIPASHSVRHSVLLDSRGALLTSPQTLVEAEKTDADTQAAYIIYTSGSTGVPKGVAISRANLCNVLVHFKQTLEVSESARPWIAHTTICFDIALLEFFLPLITDSALEIIDASVSRNGIAFKALLEKYKGNFALQATPSTFNLLRSVGWTPEANSLLFCGGEPFPPWLCEVSSQVYNVYGPTETTIWSTNFHSKGFRPLPRLGVPIGSPIRNTSIFLEKISKTQGELIIGGAGVSLGYWKRPELTEERFFEDLEGRHFRTGDSVVEVQTKEKEQEQETQETLLFCIGRKDEQVKLNGFRIELGEIETLLHHVEGVRQAAVQVKCNMVNMKVLVAYIVWKAEIKVDEVMRFLKKQLPDYMLPQHIVTLQNLPMTLNGPLTKTGRM